LLSLTTFFEFGELDGLKDLLNTLLEEFNLQGLDALVIVDEVIVNGAVALNTIEDTSFEEAFTTWALLDELTGDLATISTVHNHTLVAHISGEDSVNSAVEHEAVIVELLDTCGRCQGGAGLVAVLLDEGLSNSCKRLRVAVLELNDWMILVDFLLHADVLL